MADEKKTEDGVEFPAEAYAYVPDRSSPSTWKIRLWETPSSKETTAQVGRALAAFSPGGFRGQKVQIPSADIAGVKAKVRAAWRKVNQDKDPSEMPEYIKKGFTMTMNDIEAKLEELEPQVATLTKAADDANAEAAFYKMWASKARRSKADMSDMELAHFQQLEADEKKRFLAASPEERKAMIEEEENESKGAKKMKKPDDEESKRKAAEEEEEESKARKAKAEEEEESKRKAKEEEESKARKAAYLKAKEQVKRYEEEEEEEESKRRKASKSADDPVAKRLESLEKRNEELAKKLAASEEAVELATFIKKAETELPHMPGDPAEKGRLLKSLAALPPADFKGIYGMLTAGDTAISMTMRAQGSSLSKTGTGSAEAKLESIAKSRATAEKISFEKAYTLVISDPANKELYEQFKSEHPEQYGVQ